MVKQNFKYSLYVYEGDNEKVVGSEIEPKLLGREERDTTWEVGSGSIYTRTDKYVYWLVIQDNRPIIIMQYSQYGHYPEDEPYWEAYECTHLASGKGVFRWALEDTIDED